MKLRSMTIQLCHDICNLVGAIYLYTATNDKIRITFLIWKVFSNGLDCDGTQQAMEVSYLFATFSSSQAPGIATYTMKARDTIINTAGYRCEGEMRVVKWLIM